MNDQSKTKQVLIQELALLRQRIKEMERLESEYQQTEEALKESEEKYRNLIVTTSEGFWLLDSDKKTIDVNQSLCDMLGYSRSEMIGKTPFDFVSDENLKIFKEQTSKITSTLHRTYEIMLKKKNGTDIPAIFNATSLIDKKGKPAGSFTFVTDITERKRAEQQLKDRMKEQQALYHLGEIARRDGPTSDKLYQEFTDILPQGWRYPEIACARIVIGDSEFHTKDFAESAWMQSAPVKVSGTVVGKIEVGYLEEMPKEGEGPFLKEEKLLIDSIAERLGQITERKLAEEKIKASLHEKEVLLRELHHRTRNNMQLICSLLSLKSASDNNEHVKSVLMEMENRIKSMALVHQKLNKSADFSHVHLDEYINDLVPLLMQSYRMSSDRITTTIDVDEAVVVSIDMAIPCGLIFNELIANSLQHAFPGDRKGEICIGLKKDEDGMIELAVSDNGIGVPPDFDFMSSATLGLTTIFGLGSQLDGEVIFEREIGLSCRVRFYNKPFRTMV